jgi:hypothetical protein
MDVSAARAQTAAPTPMPTPSLAEPEPAETQAISEPLPSAYWRRIKK